MIQTFVIVHKQELIDQTRKKFASIPNLTFLAVGNEKFNEANDVVLCKSLPKNIEKFWRLLHYTAFYAVINNPELINPKATHLRFLEYDVIFDVAYHSRSNQTISQGKYKIYGHKKAPLGQGFLVNDREWQRLEQLIANAYLYLKGRSINTVIQNSAVCKNSWIETTNLIFEKQAFINYYKWVGDYVPFLINGFPEADIEAGNNLERLTTLYCADKGIEFGIVDGLKNSYLRTWLR